MRVRRTPPQGLGPLLRAARKRAGLSQSETARRAGLGQGYVWMLENGQRTPSMKVAELLADTLGLTLDECRTLYAAAVSDAGRSHPARASHSAGSTTPRR
ncbi:helix-turn-helix domain-containing protein [Streptomyces fulvoviolaceus]|uniref:helix-turn-helix domain-containing protein n=1 Tax=Streptomyces fulvoviolaceus TaxID=285535 RepID=UPI0021C1BA10|nr:helix-turn-helix transcriptional regulator [Streptomyces fulvoviolaceus]MCT9078791.1 helix-turn-helix domain-containing protein [Streptomyces fulvoviolaceus]